MTKPFKTYHEDTLALLDRKVDTEAEAVRKAIDAHAWWKFSGMTACCQDCDQGRRCNCDVLNCQMPAAVTAKEWNPLESNAVQAMPRMSIRQRLAAWWKRQVVGGPEWGE